MRDVAGNLVPKVHPATRAVEQDDPMTLHATAVSGDPDVLIRSVVQEYAWLGWNAEQVLSLFRDPGYPLLHGLWLAFGEPGIRDRLHAAWAGNAVPRLRVTIRESQEDPEPEMVQIGLQPKGNRHGDGQ